MERAVKGAMRENFSRFRVAKQEAYRDYLTETNLNVGKMNLINKNKNKLQGLPD